MSDFFDRVGDQLSKAQGRAQSQATVDSQSGRSMSGRRRRIVLSTLVASVALAAPALAITTPWSPSLERTGIDQPVAVNDSPVSTAVRDSFGVLRRDQSVADRERAAPLVRTIGAGNQVDGVQLDGIRSVGDGWALVPAKSMKTGPGLNAGTDVLCLTDGQSVGCAPASSASTAGVEIVSATATETRIAGLVPDGVTTVRFSPVDGSPVRASVESNFFSLSAPQTAPATTIKAPPGYEGGATVPAPPMPATGTVQWLDDNGNGVGAARPAVGG